jgi:mTERF domain-containing protein
VVLWLPAVLGYSYDDNLEPSLAKLQERLGLKEPELKKVVLRHPAVLGYSYEDNLEPSLAKLQERLGLKEPELKTVVLALPSVLGYSYEGNLPPKLDHLQAELGLTLDALRERVLKNPLLLGASLDTLRPNIVLWREWLAEEGLQLAEVIAKRGPRILTASFAKRTRPRSERAKALGLKASAMVGAAGLPDAAFDKRLARAAACVPDEL